MSTKKKTTSELFNEEVSSPLAKLKRQAQAQKSAGPDWSKDTGLIQIKPKQKGGGRVINVERLEPLMPALQLYYELWLAYPEKLLQWYLPRDTRFSLFPFQIMSLRANIRHKYTFQVATRGFSKTFIAILTKIIQCILMPGTKQTMVAEHKTQMAKIGREKFNELFGLMPSLDLEVNRKKGSQTTFGDDYIRLVFKNKSELDLVGVSNSTRGGRRHGLLSEEVKDLPGPDMNSVVLPLLNISRRTYAGVLLPNEPHQQQLYVGSAGYRNSWAYDKCIEVTIMSALQPEKAFSWGADYRVPLKYGLLNADFVEELKNSNTYSEADFAREFLSKWTNTVEGSLFDFEKLAGLRRVKKAEWKPYYRDNVFYVASLDVARSKARSVLEIFKVYIGEEKFKTKLVNIFLWEGRNFHYQSQKLKELHATFNFSSVVIDGNGMGVGLIDMLLLETEHNGELYPPWGIQNIEDYPDYQKDMKDGNTPVLHIIKTNQHSAGTIHVNAYNMMFGGKVELLIDEKVAKDQLISLPNYSAMTTAEKLRYMEPYKNTSLLVSETTNLKLNNQQVYLKLEKISSEGEKDTFSALEYGLWKISLMEKEQYRQKRKRISWSAALKKN